jgi:hypothetical protein
VTLSSELPSQPQFQSESNDPSASHRTLQSKMAGQKMAGQVEMMLDRTAFRYFRELALLP